MQDALVIDDNRNTADALQRMLEVLGVPARVAYGSIPALALLRSFTPSLVMLDINMPGLSGTEILSYLRREPRLARVPVIVITADDQPETRRKIMAVGVLAMMIKPATIDALEEVLKRARLI